MNLFWQVEGNINIDGNRVMMDGGNLSIISTKKEDHGTYECVASNTVATIVAVTELYILSEFHTAMCHRTEY